MNFSKNSIGLILSEIQRNRRQLIKHAQDINDEYMGEKDSDKSLWPTVVWVENNVVFIWERKVQESPASGSTSFTGFNRVADGNFTSGMSEKQISAFIKAEVKLDALRESARKLFRLEEQINSVVESE